MSDFLNFILSLPAITMDFSWWVVGGMAVVCLCLVIYLTLTGDDF